MKILNEYTKIINNVPEKIFKVTVHTFSLGDVEDPIIYAAEPLMQWEKSDTGQFIMSTAIIKPEWKQWLDTDSYGIKVAIIAELKEKDLNYFILKYL